MNKNKSGTAGFNSWVHKFGISSGLILMVLMLAVPIIICSVFDIWPPMGTLIPTFVAIVLMFLPFCFAESIAFTPIIGAGSVYMAYITGNTTALKLPCALGALAIAQVDQGTDEANAVSLVAVGTSSITVMGIILIGLALAAPLSPILNSPSLKPAFDNVVPALMGALLGTNMFGKAKYYIAPMCIALIFGRLIPTPISMAYYMLIAIAIALIVGFLSDKRKTKAGKSA